MRDARSRSERRSAILMDEDSIQALRARLEAIYVSPRSAWLVGAILLAGMFFSGR